MIKKDIYIYIKINLDNSEVQYKKNKICRYLVKWSSE
jgi:hypothetical protein